MIDIIHLVKPYVFFYFFQIFALLQFEYTTEKQKFTDTNVLVRIVLVIAEPYLLVSSFNTFKIAINSFSTSYAAF